MIYKSHTFSQISYFTLFVLFLSIQTLQAQTTLVYPKLTHNDTQTGQYTLKLLKLALEHSGSDYILKEDTHAMVQSRSLRELKQNKVLNIVWSMTSKERENNLLPIRIPIYKGLIGYRLLLINIKDKSKFKNINSKKEFQKLLAGQGHDWPDTDILRSNGIKVRTGASYQGLFKMLKRNRFDYFPRSIIEVWDEYEVHKNSGLIIEPSLLIQYKTASYFFVWKENKKLAKDLKKGLEKIIQNDLFDKLFYQYYQSFLDKSNLKNRKIFNLENSQLSQETPLNKKELWITQ